MNQETQSRKTPSGLRSAFSPPLPLETVINCDSSLKCSLKLQERLGKVNVLGVTDSGGFTSLFHLLIGFSSLILQDRSRGIFEM